MKVDQTRASSPARAGEDGAVANAHWYAIWTRSRHEQMVREQLTQKAIEAFLPTVTRWSRWKDRRKKIDWPLFPGYCFARFDPIDRLAVLKCAGVVSIVGFEGGEPAPIPEHEIDGIRRSSRAAWPTTPVRSSARARWLKWCTVRSRGRRPARPEERQGTAGAVGGSDRSGGERGRRRGGRARR
jgi:transcription antitermination factor NusG